MPSRFANTKRSAPVEFDESKRPGKMMRSELTPTSERTLKTAAMTPASAPSPSAGTLKRKSKALDASNDFTASKKARLDTTFDDSGTTTISPTGCRGGKKRRRRVIVDDSSDGDNDDATTGNTRSPSTGKDTAEVSTATEQDAAVTTNECATKAGEDSNNSSEPVSSSRKSVSGSIETADISSSSSEPASSSHKPANGSSETLDTVITASEPEEVTKKSARMAERKQRHINGLLNNSNQCFSNATLQFFDAAMDGHDLDIVLGKDVSIAPFSEPDLSLADSLEAPKRGEKSAAKPVSRLSKIKASIRDRISKSRSEGKLKDISPRKHLRALLDRMRRPRSNGEPKWVTPLVFQQILAYGDESAGWTDLDGTTQEDCYQYFGALMSGAASIGTDEELDVATEDGAESAEALKSLFEITSEIATVCGNPSCDHKCAVQVETENAHSISVRGSSKRVELMGLLDASNTSTLEGECPKCGKEELARVTEFKEVGDNLVLHINRIDPVKEGNKLTTPVDLPLSPITICGKEFVLNAVVRHRGYTVNAGHYTVLRRRSPEWMTETKSLWYSIDDEQIKSIDSSDVKDHGRYGHSAMLLFKAL